MNTIAEKSARRKTPITVKGRWRIQMDLDAERFVLQPRPHGMADVIAYSAEGKEVAIFRLATLAVARAFIAGAGMTMTMESNCTH